MRIIFYCTLRIKTSDVSFHNTIKISQLLASEISPFLEHRIINSGERPVVFWRFNICHVAESKPFFPLFGGIFVCKIGFEILNGHRMLEYFRIGSHTCIIKMNKVNLHILNSYPYHLFHVVYESGMHEIDTLAECLCTAIPYRRSQVIGCKPSLSLWFFEKEGFISNCTANIYSYFDPMFLAKRCKLL